MEEQILELETLVEKKQKYAEQPEIVSSASSLNEAYRELEETKAELDKLYARWAKLEELMN